jgi:hypothetical protein
MQMHLCDDHILAIFASDQQAANDVVAQVSMVIAKLNEAPCAETALVRIQSAEGAESVLQSCSQEVISEFLTILREMEPHLQRGQLERASSPHIGERTSIDKKQKQLSNAPESPSPSSVRPNVLNRLSRSSTFSGAVGDSFLPHSRRGSVAGHDHTMPSPSLGPSSMPSYNGSPLLRAAVLLGRNAESAGRPSGLLRRDSLASRDRRDSDSSTALSSSAALSLSAIAGSAQVAAAHACASVFF